MRSRIDRLADDTNRPRLDQFSHANAFEQHTAAEGARGLGFRRWQCAGPAVQYPGPAMTRQVHSLEEAERRAEQEMRRRAVLRRRGPWMIVAAIALVAAGWLMHAEMTTTASVQAASSEVVHVN
jgi:hypothetical protein